MKKHLPVKVCRVPLQPGLPSYASPVSTKSATLQHEKQACRQTHSLLNGVSPLCRCLFCSFISKVPVVFHSGKVFCSFIHQINIELIFNPPHILFPEGSTPSAYLVYITTGICIVPGMKFRMGFFNIYYTDIRRKPVIDTIFNFQGQQVSINSQVIYLSDCMNATVSASGSEKVKLFTFKQLSACIQHLSLNCLSAFLHLPARITGSVIFYCQFESAHCHSFNNLQRYDKK